MIRRPPVSIRPAALFPYTPLFRSGDPGGWQESPAHTCGAVRCLAGPIAAGACVGSYLEASLVFVGPQAQPSLAGALEGVSSSFLGDRLAGGPGPQMRLVVPDGLALALDHCWTQTVRGHGTADRKSTRLNSIP